MLIESASGLLHFLDESGDKTLCGRTVTEAWSSKTDTNFMFNSDDLCEKCVEVENKLEYEEGEVNEPSVEPAKGFKI